MENCCFTYFQQVQPNWWFWKFFWCYQIPKHEYPSFVFGDVFFIHCFSYFPQAIYLGLPFFLHSRSFQFNIFLAVCCWTSFSHIQPKWCFWNVFWCCLIFKHERSSLVFDDIFSHSLIFSIPPSNFSWYFPFNALRKLSV